MLKQSYHDQPTIRIHRPHPTIPVGARADRAGLPEDDTFEAFGEAVVTEEGL